MAKPRKTYEKEDGTKEKLIPLTTRFTEPTYGIIRDLSLDYNESMAEVTRMATESSLDKYFSVIRWLDHEDAKVINHNIAVTAKLFKDAVFQLRKIGVNYNQDVQIKNLQRKIDEYNKKIQSLGPTETTLLSKYLEEQNALMQQKEKLEAQTRDHGLDVSVIENLVNQLTAATTKCGDELCRILG